MQFEIAMKTSGVLILFRLLSCALLRVKLDVIGFAALFLCSIIEMSRLIGINSKTNSINNIMTTIEACT